jgi:hypothetical protein
LIRRTADATARTSRALGPRPEATMQYVPARRAHASCAPATIVSSSSSEYFGTGACETIDCEQ